MARNPLEGLSRYINVDYREPDESVVDSIFGTYAERMDRDITKANLQLERDRLKYNADLAEQKYQQGRIDKARQNLVNDIQGTWTSMGDKPYWMIENQLSGIGSAYVDILGQDDVNSIMSRHNELEPGKRDGYGAASKNNYEIIQTLGNEGEITTAKGLIDLDNKFVFSADQGGAYNSARNIRAKTVLRDDRDISLAWDEAFENHDSYDKAYPRQLEIKKQLEKDLGIDKASTDQQRLDKQTALLKLEKVDSIEDTTKWKEYENVIAWTKEATQVRRAFKRYQENPWLFIKETYKEPEANAALNNPLFNPEYFAQKNVMTSDDIVNGALGVVDNLSSSIQATPLDTTSVDSVVNVLENISGYGDDFSSYQESVPQYEGYKGTQLSDFVRGPDTEDPFVRTNILNDVSDIAAGNKTTDDVVNQKLESLTLTSSGEDSLSYDFDEASVDETNFKDVLPSYLRPNVLESVGPRKKEDAILQAPDGTLFYTQEEVDNWRSAQRNLRPKDEKDGETEILRKIADKEQFKRDKKVESIYDSSISSDWIDLKPRQARKLAKTERRTDPKGRELTKVYDPKFGQHPFDIGAGFDSGGYYHWLSPREIKKWEKKNKLTKSSAQRKYKGK